MYNAEGMENWRCLIKKCEIYSVTAAYFNVLTSTILKEQNGNSHKDVNGTNWDLNHYNNTLVINTIRMWPVHMILGCHSSGHETKPLQAIDSHPKFWQNTFLPTSRLKNTLNNQPASSR
jgi:hypothetical protein